MKTIADADYYSAIRLLTALSQRPGNTRKEKEDARKASLLTKKLKRNEEIRLHKVVSHD